MKKTTTLLLLVATALFQPLTLQAKPGKGDLSIEERMEKARERMSQIDSDGDGNISYVEAEAADAKRIVENFDSIDTDGDGVLTREELRAHKKQRGPGKKKPGKGKKKSQE
ncbi:MAG: hypothetical protein ACON39_02480 [Coraliomargaritaceae bacterium]